MTHQVSFVFDLHDFAHLRLDVLLTCAWMFCSPMLGCRGGILVGAARETSLSGVMPETLLSGVARETPLSGSGRFPATASIADGPKTAGVDMASREIPRGNQEAFTAEHFPPNRRCSDI